LRQLKYLPCTLTCLRLLLGPLALICAFQDYGRWIYLPILATNTEIIAIHLRMDQPPVDIKSILALPKPRT